MEGKHEYPPPPRRKEGGDSYRQYLRPITAAGGLNIYIGYSKTWAGDEKLHKYHPSISRQDYRVNDRTYTLCMTSTFHGVYTLHDINLSCHVHSA